MTNGNKHLVLQYQHNENKPYMLLTTCCLDYVIYLPSEAFDILHRGPFSSIVSEHPHACNILLWTHALKQRWKNVKEKENQHAAPKNFLTIKSRILKACTSFGCRIIALGMFYRKHKS